MSRRPLVRRTFAAAIALFALAVAALAPAQGAAAAGRPNIVLVLTDDQRWDTLQHMPVVSRELVDRGVTFSNAFVVNPLCCPSRASILTGQYSHTTGVYRNRGTYGGYEAFRDSSTVATWLDAGGYATAYIGKYMNGYDLGRVPPGWDRWVAYQKDFYSYELNVDGTLEPHATDASDYSTDVLREHALTFIDRRARDPAPLFMVFAPYAPHPPATPAPRHEGAFSGLALHRPPSYNEADGTDKPRWLRIRRLMGEAGKEALETFRRNQLASLLAVDEAVGALIDKLEATGRLDNTLIVYTSDNGLLWGEHRLAARKAVPYEESVRVPLVMRYDALVRAPRTETGLVANIDLAPTFAEVGGTTPPSVDGRSVVPILAGQDAPGRKAILIEHLAEPFGVRPLVPTYCAVRKARWKYVAYPSREEELYDLARDPYELRNRAADASARSTLLAMRATLKARCVPPPPGFGTDWICTVEPSGIAATLIGTDVADTICGSSRPDRLYGGAESDIIRAGAGDDGAWGQDGDDRLVGGRGHDRLFGGAGNDTIDARDAKADRVSCGVGVDTVYADALDTSAADCESVDSE